jgi:hypothetical protein
MGGQGAALVCPGARPAARAPLRAQGLGRGGGWRGLQRDGRDGVGFGCLGYRFGSRSGWLRAAAPTRPRPSTKPPQLKAGIPKKEAKAQARAAAALAARMRLHERLVFTLNVANTSAALFVPCWAVHATRVRGPGGGKAGLPRGGPWAGRSALAVVGGGGLAGSAQTQASSRAAAKGAARRIQPSPAARGREGPCAARGRSEATTADPPPSPPEPNETAGNRQADLLPGFALTLMTITLWMKLVSYAHCHTDLRDAHRQVGAVGAAAVGVGSRGCWGCSGVWAQRGVGSGWGRLGWGSTGLV